MMLDAVNIHLEAKGIKIATGTIVDATIIHAPSSTKNASGERDPEMHQTKKGNQWYFGLKAHIGVDAKEGTVHSVVTTAANVADSTVLPELLHGEERKVWGDGRVAHGRAASRRGGVGLDGCEEKSCGHLNPCLRSETWSTQSCGSQTWATRRVHRSAAESLDGRRSGGYSATDARPCVFNTFTHSNRRVYTEQPRHASFSS